MHWVPTPPGAPGLGRSPDRAWRDYYKHVDARRRYANPTEENLIAQQLDRRIEEDSKRRENEERVAQYNYFAARASNRSAWARAGMG